MVYPTSRTKVNNITVTTYFTIFLKWYEQLDKLYKVVMTINNLELNNILSDELLEYRIEIRLKRNKARRVINNLLKTKNWFFLKK